MRLSARGFTLPWQLVELQEPGPVYFPASAGGFAASPELSEAKKVAASQTTAHRSVERLASGPILIPVLGWSPPYLRRPWGRPASEFLYCPFEVKSTKGNGSISWYRTPLLTVMNLAAIKSPSTRIAATG